MAAAGFDRYLKASKGRPARRLRDGTMLIATNTTHGPSQARCQRCHGMCKPVHGNQGEPLLLCSTCGATFQARKF